jgi:type II secretory pathway component GspD/PulD (secretin)
VQIRCWRPTSFRFLSALVLAALALGTGCATRPAATSPVAPASSGEVLATSASQTASLDPGMMQVVLEAFAVEVNENKTRDIGVDSSFNRNIGNTLNNLEVDRLASSFAPGLAEGVALNYASVNKYGAFNAQLQALLDSGDAEIRTRPIVATLNNTEAAIQTVDRVPYQDIIYEKNGQSNLGITFRDVGIKLKVRPEIQSPLEKGMIKIFLNNIEVSGVSHFVTVRNVDRPVFVTSKANSDELLVRDGETLVIGGLKSKREVVVEKRTPYIGAIPGLGWAFKNEHKEVRDTDLLFFITPHLLPPGANPVLPYNFEHKDILTNPLASPSLEKKSLTLSQ